MKSLKLVALVAFLFAVSVAAHAEKQTQDSDVPKLSLEEIIEAKKLQCEENDERLAAVIETARKEDAEKADALEEARQLDQQACAAEIEGLEERLKSE